MRVIINNSYSEICNWVAIYIKKAIKKHSSDKPFVIGLPTGSTPIGVYKLLIQYYKKGELSFKNVVTFNMDEYVGLSPQHTESYHYFMYTNLFNHIDIPKENIHLLNGMTDDLELECNKYEDAIKNSGGIDLFLCGIGRDGHIAFNEPGSSFSSKTRIKTLSDETIMDNSKYFSDVSSVPRQALTVGVKTVMDAREVIIMASGNQKAQAIRECIEGSVSNQFTCTAIQMHSKATIICDKKATYELKVKTYEYYINLQKNIDILGKPITNYITKYISNQDIVIITSPHPDDDVIGLGGSMQHMPNKSNVKIVYMTNGMGGLRDVDNLGIQTRIKEAISSVKVLGYDKASVFDIGLPFYNNKNRDVSEDDINKMEKFLSHYGVNHLFVCIDKDPKNTHIKCAKIIQKCKFPRSLKKIWLYKSAWGIWDSELESNVDIYISREHFNKKLLSIDMHLSQINPMVSDRELTTFKDIVLMKNKSDKYPEHFQERFRIVDVDEFKSLKL